jgi:hypothetical protein
MVENLKKIEEKIMGRMKHHILKEVLHCSAEIMNILLARLIFDSEQTDFICIAVDPNQTNGPVMITNLDHLKTMEILQDTLQTIKKGQALDNTIGSA